MWSKENALVEAEDYIGYVPCVWLGLTLGGLCPLCQVILAIFFGGFSLRECTAAIFVWKLIRVTVKSLGVVFGLGTWFILCFFKHYGRCLSWGVIWQSPFHLGTLSVRGYFGRGLDVAGGRVAKCVYPNELWLHSA